MGRSGESEAMAQTANDNNRVMAVCPKCGLRAEVASSSTTILDPDSLCKLANVDVAQCEHLRSAVSKAHDSLRRI
jgi:hypothetical protein